MSTEPFLLEVNKNVAVITINQPSKLNALSGEDYATLAAQLRKVELMDEVSITVIIGAGRYFSAGADVTSKATIEGPPSDEPHATRLYWLRRFAANNIDVTKTFFHHPKILIAALNGPAVGLSAALVGMCDFVYASDTAFILTPFTSLGLVTEGGSSVMFVKRMGLAKAKEALMLSKRISIEELLQTGFVNKVFPAGEGFKGEVLKYVGDVMGDHLDHGSMMEVKKLIRDSMVKDVEVQNVREAFAGMERFISGAPQRQFMMISSKEKKHKL